MTFRPYKKKSEQQKRKHPIQNETESVFKAFFWESLGSRQFSLVKKLSTTGKDAGSLSRVLKVLIIHRRRAQTTTVSARQRGNDLYPSPAAPKTQTSQHIINRIQYNTIVIW